MTGRDPEREHQASDPATMAAIDPVREHWVRVAVFLLVAVLAGLLSGLLIGCAPAASSRALDRYSMVMQADGTIQERCKASGDVADAFLEEGDREAYGRWRLIHEIQCAAPGPMVVG